MSFNIAKNNSNLTKQGDETMNITELFYPGYLIITFILTITFIPKKRYKEYFLYGVLIGGLGDIIIVFLMQNILGIMWFKNQGIFNFYGQIAFSPPGWTVTFMIFLHFLPKHRKWFLYPYLIAWTFASLAFGKVAQNVGLFDFTPWLYPVPGFLIFLGWWSFGAWLFMKTSPLAHINQYQHN